MELTLDFEPICKHCQGTRHTCGPMVKPTGAPDSEYVGLQHLPKLGYDRRQFRG